MEMELQIQDLEVHILPQKLFWNSQMDGIALVGSPANRVIGMQNASQK